jgi:pimeloyl-ACP methyl ester carboxylesterase
MIRLIGATLNFLSRIVPGLAGRWTFALFCHSRLSKMRDSERETHGEAVAETLAVNGNRVVTYRWGNGEHPVLLLHGWESRSSRYAGFVHALRERGLSAISFDAPGHGDSEGSATILEYYAIIRQLYERYGRFQAIVAHSFGVPCAFLAVRRGVETDRLVALSGPCDFSYLTEKFCGQLGLRPALHDDLRRRTEEFFAPEETDIWNRFSVSYDPSQIQIPVLVIHDEDDDMVALEQGRKIAAAYAPQATIVITKGLGHRRILSDDGVIATVADFVLESGGHAAALRSESERDGMAATQ